MDNLFKTLGIDLSILEDDELSNDLNNKDIGLNPFNIENIKNNIENFSTKKICNIIITNRYLGFNKELNIFCMTELAKRRKNGEDFLFEEYIDKELDKLPKLKFETQNLFNIIASLRNKK